jgi:hypothetical protein
VSSALAGRRSLWILFGLFLASGLTAGVYFVWALADWILPEGEGAFGLFFVGAVSFIPVTLAWVIGGIHLFLKSREREVRVGVALTTAHLVWWLILIGFLVWSRPRAWAWAFRSATILEPGLYAVGVSLLAARWFWRRRSDGPVRALA